MIKDKETLIIETQDNLQDSINSPFAIKKRKEIFFKDIEEYFFDNKSSSREKLNLINLYSNEQAKVEIVKFEALSAEQRKNNFNLEKFITSRWGKIIKARKENPKDIYSQEGLYLYLFLLDKAYPEDMDRLMNIIDKNRNKILLAKLRDDAEKY